MQFQRPYSGTNYRSYQNDTLVYQGTKTDTNIDVRSPLVRTARGRWRPPTSYSRSVDSGFIYTYNVQLRSTNRTSGAPAGRLDLHQGAGACNVSGYYYDAVPPIPGYLQDKAVFQCLSNLKNSKINLAQAYGERAQTARLVGDTLTRLTKMVKGIKRLDPKAIKAALVGRGGSGNAFFDYWLELQYGWKPMLMDVHGAMSALHDREKEADRGMVSVKGHASESDYTVRQLPNDSIAGQVFRAKKVRRIKHKLYVRMDFTPSNAPMTGTLASTGITNPAELAWELMPWSFVADWFVPVGDYLSTLDATLGWDFKGGSVSKITTVESHPTSGELIFDQYALQPRGGYCIVNGKGRQMRMTRTALGSPLTVQRPHLKKSHSGTHVANGIALLMSAIIGGTRVR